MVSEADTLAAAKEKEKRASRACLACRMRKTRCDLDFDGVPDRPPCRQCVQKDQECVLTISRRGGRRVRKRPKMAASVIEKNTAQRQTQDNRVTISPPISEPAPAEEPTTADATINDTSTNPGTQNNPFQHPSPANHPTPSSQGYESSWTTHHRASQSSSSQPTSISRHWVGEAQRTALDQQSHDAHFPNHQRPQLPMSNGDIEGRIGTTDLLNPSDALDLLAQVADLDGENGGGANGINPQHNNQPTNTVAAHHDIPGQHSLHHSRDSQAAAVPYFPPISDGVLTLSDAHMLLQHYREHYHPHFPVADVHIFETTDILALAVHEPHLLTAVLTVSSKDDTAWSTAHEACSRHMEMLVGQIIYHGSSAVEAVEALLILAEWAPRPPRGKPTAGRGEEDHGAWMQIGVAIRLGYSQGLEQTGLVRDVAGMGMDELNRKRLVWAACYMCDRQVSIRLGKGFWSRGPGPSTVLRASDFPLLRLQKVGSDDLSHLFQAHLELTQLFGNAHDLLYSSTMHREQLCIGGEYVRYLDDFTASLRKWKIIWGSLGFTPHVKAALLLSYDFLRLYINAFALQANLDRALARVRQQPSSPGSRGSIWPLFSDLTSIPDARFIYESVDAANSLLSTLNGFVDPVSGLRYMPLKYYFFVIYAAVFLFKARLAGALGAEASSSVRRIISVTIERLKQSSTNQHSLGQRYARSLYLLWRKSPGRTNMGLRNPVRNVHHMNGSQMNASGATPTGLGSGSTNSETGENEANPYGIGAEFCQVDGFSWRDLDGLGQFIGNDSGMGEDFRSPWFESDLSPNSMNAAADGSMWYDIGWDRNGNSVVF